MPRNALRLAICWVVGLVCLSVAGMAQSGEGSAFPPINEAEAPPALVRSVRVLPERDGPALEIITTRPLTPVITRLENPTRLVIDLPKSLLPDKQKVAFKDEQVARVRVNQFQKKPPVVRLVVDLTKPCGFGWDEAGNRLMIRLRPEAAEAKKSSTSAPAVFVEGTAPGSGVSGTIVPASSRVGNTSSVTAGPETAIVKLVRGGELHVCPGTTVSVTASQTGNDLMLGMSTGALEAHYQSTSSTDSVLTPDFRILLPGPGKFDFAISADSRGNTCVRALPGNTSSAMVAELMGDGTYEVKPSEEVVFRAGKVELPDIDIPADCGCPANSVPTMRVSGSTPAAGEAAGSAASPAPAGALTATSGDPEAASLPTSQPSQTHVQVEAPLVFNAADLPPAAKADADTLADKPARAKTESITILGSSTAAPGPETAANPPRPGFFGRVKKALSSLFH